MNRFKLLSGRAVPLPIDNVDTDQIIPAQFLKLLSRKGLGRYLFYRWRYDEKGKRKDFVLDERRYRGASILLAGRNFGIGSSRENAVWALTDFGIRAVLAPSFGDIFYGNAVKNYLVCIRLPEREIHTLQEKAAAGPIEVTVDLVRQEVTSGDGLRVEFDMEAHVRKKLIERLDDIDLALASDEQIREYESRREGSLQRIDLGLPE